MAVEEDAALWVVPLQQRHARRTVVNNHQVRLELGFQDEVVGKRNVLREPVAGMEWEANLANVFKF